MRRGSAAAALDDSSISSPSISQRRCGDLTGPRGAESLDTGWRCDARMCNRFVLAYSLPVSPSGDRSLSPVFTRDSSAYRE